MIIVVLNGIIGVLIALLLSKELDVIPGILGGVAGVGVVLILMKVFSKPSPQTG